MLDMGFEPQIRVIVEQRDMTSHLQVVYSFDEYALNLVEQSTPRIFLQSKNVFCQQDEGTHIIHDDATGCNRQISFRGSTDCIFCRTAFELKKLNY